MNIVQTQKVEKDLHVLLPNNLFVPPRGDVCLINNLPPELSRILAVGAADNHNEDEDSDVMGDHRRGLLCALFGAKNPDDEECHDDDMELADEGVAVSDATESSDFPSPWPPFQTLASHVCRRLRDVALSTPSLWTTIAVTPEIRTPYEPVSTLLERSKGLPIDVSVNFKPHCNISPTDNCAPSDEYPLFLYNLLTPHAHRWRTVEVTVPEYHHMF